MIQVMIVFVIAGLMLHMVISLANNQDNEMDNTTFVYTLHEDGSLMRSDYSCEGGVLYKREYGAIINQEGNPVKCTHKKMLYKHYRKAMEDK